MICAIHQPQYLPWLGFFSKLDAADVFVLYDDTQYKHDEWQNRNRIKAERGPQWLTVPVHHRQNQLIRNIEIDRTRPWPRKHARAIEQNYAVAPFYRERADELRAMYGHAWTRLADLNIATIRLLCAWLGIQTPTILSSELRYRGRATDALVSICKTIGADTYLSGAGGREYLQTDKFDRAGVTLLFHDFQHPEYHQQFGPFVPFLSALDLVLNCGPGSLEIIRSGRIVTPHNRDTEDTR